MYSPLRKASLRRTSRAKSRVVAMPSISSSPSARSPRAIAAGESLSITGRAARSGHAIEIRINAEDPTRDFAPSPGRIERLRAPNGPGVRLDTHVDTGSTIPPFYDSLIAKLVVWDADRPAAIARGLRALGELEIEGIATTRDFARDVLRSEAFRSGESTTSYLDEHSL